MSARWCPSCGKDGYRSYGAAASAAQHCNRKRDAILRVYHGGECAFWHLTKRVDMEVAA